MIGWNSSSVGTFTIIAARLSAIIGDENA